VDTNTTFRLSLWTDVPAQPGTTNNYSHPGQLLCSSLFYPPQAVGTSLARYNYRLDVSNVFERFYDPDIPGTGGFIGTDTQIWRYDFYPREACWRQTGTPSAPRTYWLSLSANTVNVDQNLFGWKTSTNHWNDDGVWGHTNNFPPGDWKDLRDPRNGKSLDLSFALRSFPVVGVNKDIRNTTTQNATGIEIVVAGIHEVTWHYDDSPPWPNFSVTYAGGNTVLRWTGKVVPPGAGAASVSHVGFEMGGTAITYVSLSWLSATGIIGPAIQVGHHSWNNGATLVLNNELMPTPVTVLGGSVEFYEDPVGLDQMVLGGNRNPLATYPLDIQPGAIIPGCTMRIPIRQPLPPRARYAMYMIQLGDEQGLAATLDFIQLPLDMAIQPVVTGLNVGQGMLSLRWPTMPDRAYRIQGSTDLRSSFFDIFTEIMGDGSEMDMDVPLLGSQGFYRILLDPE